MKLNAKTAIQTPTLWLVPYTATHVPTYHTWMQDPELQAATASEPLSLDEEYEMQKSWREDADKLTFIACLPTSGSRDASDGTRKMDGSGGRDERGEDMIGDVNLFLYEDEDGNEDGKESSALDLVGEIEIMIAKKEVQGAGYGKAVLLHFMWYITASLDGILAEYGSKNDVRKEMGTIKYLRAKIGAGNARSLSLFEKVGFRKVTEKPNYFGELELRLPITAQLRQDLDGRINDPLDLVEYP